MNILFIEDESNKAQQVIRCLKENISGITIDEKKSYTSGVSEIRKRHYDYVLLDMSLPLYDIDKVPNDDQNEFEAFAGRDILEEMQRIGYKTKSIVITAFDILGENEYQIDLGNLDLEMRNQFPDIYLGAIHYNVSSLEWKKALLDYFVF